MADKHPYMSGSGGIVQTIAHLRRSFPAQVTAETLKKLGIASNNETYVLNILRFVEVLDQDGKKNAKAATVFNKHDDGNFKRALLNLSRPPTPTSSASTETQPGRYLPTS